MQDFRMETFLTACRLLNYTDTAKELHITQPAVSQHIRFLEEYYKAKLFDYEGKKLRLTEAGAILRKAATTMKHDEMILQEQLITTGRSKLVFGATLTIGDFFIPESLNRYITKEQETDVCMLVDNTETLLNKINLGELDFALVEGYFHKSEYDYKIFSQQHFVAVCSNTFIRKKSGISLCDLFGERIILREKGSGTREILERHLEEKNFSVGDFHSIIEIGSIRAIKMLVSAGCGITFIYEAAVKQELEDGTLCKINLSDFDICNHFTMVWRKNSIFRDRYLSLFDDIFKR